MKCPRCKTIPEDEHALYCLVCGKKLRRDDAFDGEFEEEFRYDEEIAADEAQKTSAAWEKRTEQKKNALLLLFACLSVMLLFLLLFVLLSPDEPKEGITDETGETSADTALEVPSPTTDSNADGQDDLALAEDVCRRLLIAGNQSFDLDAILACAPPDARETVLSLLCAQYGSADRTELEECFRQLKDAHAVRIESVSVHVSEPLSKEEGEAYLLSLSLRHGLDLKNVRELRSATVTATLFTDGVSREITARYTLGKIDNRYYSLDF